MKTFKQILDEGKKRFERMRSSISDDKVIERLGNIDKKLDNKTITPAEADALYAKEGDKIKAIKSGLIAKGQYKERVNKKMM